MARINKYLIGFAIDTRLRSRACEDGQHGGSQKSMKLKIHVYIPDWSPCKAFWTFGAPKNGPL